METPDRHGADASCLEWLQREASQWAAEGLIKRDQEQYILARYGLVTAETPRTLRQVPLIHLLTALGAVLVGIGVLLVVGANWQAIPRIGRLILLMVTTGVLYAGGYHLAFERKSYPAVGKALIFIGSLVWGSSIFLVAQMFHAGGEGGEYRGVLYWFLGTLPLAYILRLPIQMALSIILGVVWVFMHPEGPMRSAESPHVVLLLFLTLGAFLYAAGLAHRRWAATAALAPALSAFGVVGIAIGLYGLAFKDMWSHFSFFGDPGAIPWLWFGPFLALALVSAAIVFVRTDDGIVHLEAIAVAVLTVIATGVLAMYPFQGWTDGDPAGWMMVVLFNLLLLGLSLGCIWLGTKKLHAGLVNAGVALFMVHVMTRYFDLFAGLMNTGLAFVTAGLILMGGGYLLEKQRRRLVLAISGRQTA